MTAALVIHPDGRVTKIDLSQGESLELMREAIGCRLVDVVQLTGWLDMWLDDEGVYTQEVNPAATVLAKSFGFVWQDYYGPVVLCGVDDDGDSVNLTRSQIVGLLAHLQELIA
jgi:hypothetical protein